MCTMSALYLKGQIAQTPPSFNLLPRKLFCCCNLSEDWFFHLWLQRDFWHQYRIQYQSRICCTSLKLLNSVTFNRLLPKHTKSTCFTITNTANFSHFSCEMHDKWNQNWDQSSKPAVLALMGNIQHWCFATHSFSQPVESVRGTVN